MHPTNNYRSAATNIADEKQLIILKHDQRTEQVIAWIALP